MGFDDPRLLTHTWVMGEPRPMAGVFRNRNRCLLGSEGADQVFEALWECTSCGLTCSTLWADGEEPPEPAEKPNFSCGERRESAVRWVLES